MNITGTNPNIYGNPLDGNINISDYEVVDDAHDDGKVEGGVRRNGSIGDEAMVEQKLERGDITGKDILRGAEIKTEMSGKATDLKLNRYAKKRSTLDSVINWLGRKFVGAAHAVKSFLSGDIFSKAWRDNNVRKYSESYSAGRIKDPGVNARMPTLPNPASGEPVKFDANLVACATACKVKTKNVGTGENQTTVSTNVTFKPFTGKLYPNGHPRLTDVVQNPELQDCWFLSGITALLANYGPDAIERLIRPNEKGDGYIVRLGDKNYEVPNGEVCVDGKSCVSDSAPWVKILEQAVAMDYGNKGTDIYGAGPGAAMQMLQGYGESSKAPPSTTVADQFVTLDLIKEAFQRRIPVVLGHVRGSDSKVDKIAGVLRDNISPGHAVTLLDLTPRGKDGKDYWMTVLDPYGRTRILSSAALERCSVSMGCTGTTVSEMREAIEANARKAESRTEVKEFNPDGDDF